MTKPQSYPAITKRYTAYVRAGRRRAEYPVGEANEYEDGEIVLECVTWPVHYPNWDGRVVLRSGSGEEREMGLSDSIVHTEGGDAKSST